MRGQAKDDPHYAVAAEYADSSGVRVSMDYCFFTEDAQATETDREDSTKSTVSMTVMLMVESFFRSMQCSAKVPQMNGWPSRSQMTLKRSVWRAKY